MVVHYYNGGSRTRALSRTVCIVLSRDLVMHRIREGFELVPESILEPISIASRFLHSASYMTMVAWTRLGGVVGMTISAL